jgi:hypothetical protein
MGFVRAACNMNMQATSFDPTGGDQEYAEFGEWLHERMATYLKRCQRVVGELGTPHADVVGDLRKVRAASENLDWYRTAVSVGALARGFIKNEPTKVTRPEGRLIYAFENYTRIIDKSVSGILSEAVRDYAYDPTVACAIGLGLTDGGIRALRWKAINRAALHPSHGKKVLVQSVDLSSADATYPPGALAAVIAGIWDGVEARGFGTQEFRERCAFLTILLTRIPVATPDGRVYFPSPGGMPSGSGFTSVGHTFLYEAFARQCGVMPCLQQGDDTVLAGTAPQLESYGRSLQRLGMKPKFGNSLSRDVVGGLSEDSDVVLDFCSTNLISLKTLTPGKKVMMAVAKEWSEERESALLLELRHNYPEGEERERLVASLRAAGWGPKAE